MEREKLEALANYSTKKGTIRLVNPWRGLVYVAEVETMHGRLSVRTKDFENFSICTWHLGHEFYLSKEFSRRELAQWVIGKPLCPDDKKKLIDEFGDIVAVTPKPDAWCWRRHMGCFRQQVLKSEFIPTTGELQKAAEVALMMHIDEFLPNIDSWEIWSCDKETNLPLALVMTGETLDDIDRITFSPLWRANCNASLDENEAELRVLTKEVNERINSASQPGRVRWVHRLFHRKPDGSAEEWMRSNPSNPSEDLAKIAEYPPGWLPSGLLAEPFESRRCILEEPGIASL